MIPLRSIRRAATAVAILAGLASATTSAQQIHTYTEAAAGGTQIPLGLPVPVAVASPSPIDGFRSYDSLNARLQALAMGSVDVRAEAVGQTQAFGRTIYAYLLSDPDAVDVDGRGEPAFLFQGGTHAREWGTPEVTTALIERFASEASGHGLVRYLLDETTTVVLPVNNVDGLLQTQRYPSQVVIGQDPTVPSSWPRDGRMRRKNMRGADELLTTFGDHLAGIDLNRNHPPFWATTVRSGGSSADPNNLVFHGAGPHSEREADALEAAAALVAPDRVRLGIDVHSYSQVFFCGNTGDLALNAIQNNLLSLLSRHHLEVTTSASNVFGVDYRIACDPAGEGIGTASEYFAYTFRVPAWTLELEPVNSNSQYGGTGASHSGFILPMSQARRVREAWTDSHVVAMYAMAGAAHLLDVKIDRVDAGTPVAAVYHGQLVSVDGGRRRVVAAGRSQSLASTGRYRMRLQFSKPMRYRNVAGAITPLPGTFALPQAPRVELVVPSGTRLLDTAGGQWSRTRWLDDSFEFEFDAAALTDGTSTLRVAASDMTGAAIDAVPETPVDFVNGSWTGLETASANGGVIGFDTSHRVSTTAAAASPVALAAPSAVAEGDVLSIAVAAEMTGFTRFALVSLCRASAPGSCIAIAPQTVSLSSDGTPATATLSARLPDDLDPTAAAPYVATVEVVTDGIHQIDRTVLVTVVDNDRDDRAFVRFEPEDVETIAARLPVAGGRNAEWVLTPRIYELPASGASNTSVSVAGSLTVTGSGASLRPAADDRPEFLFNVASSGSLALNDVVIDEANGDLPASAGTALLTSDGSVSIRRSVLKLGRGDREPSIDSRGALVFDRVDARRFHGAASGQGPLIRQRGASAAIVRSSLFANDARGRNGNEIAINSEPAAELFDSLSDGYVAADPVAVDFEASRYFPGLPSTAPACVGLTALANSGESLLYPAPDSSPPWPSFCFPGFTEADVLSADDQNSHVDRYDLAHRDCSGADLEGRPRPQQLGNPSPAAAALCDVGPIEVGVNPYRGVWQPERNGHGVDLEKIGNQLIFVWYTYGADRQPIAYGAVGPLTGRHWSAVLNVGVRDATTGEVVQHRVADINVFFEGDEAFVLQWHFDGQAAGGEERFTPLHFGGGVPSFDPTGLWYAPSAPGYGVTIGRELNTTVFGLYYYDAAGIQRWALGAGSQRDVVDVPMVVYEGFCPDCPATELIAHPAGMLRAQFLSPQRAEVTFDMRYPIGSGGDWILGPETIAPLSEPAARQMRGLAPY